MTSRISFTPSASETLVVSGSAAVVVALPAVDSGNSDLTVSHSNTQAVFLSFGAGAAVNPHGAGCIIVPPGSTVLLSSKVAVLGAARSGLVQGGPQAAAAGGSAACSVWSPGSTQLTVTRGTASIGQIF